jgi:hypothetical protein
MVNTNVKTLKIQRVSTMPNANSSYAYLILNAEDASVAELLGQVEGVYDGQDGGKLIYSRSRVGKLNTPTTATIRVTEQRVGGVGNGRHFINLVDTSIEAFGEFAEKVKQAERFGLGNQSVAAVAAFYGTGSNRVTTAPTEAAAPKAADEAAPEQTNALTGQESGA